MRIGIFLGFFVSLSLLTPSAFSNEGNSFKAELRALKSHNDTKRAAAIQNLERVSLEPAEQLAVAKLLHYHGFLKKHRTVVRSAATEVLTHVHPTYPPALIEVANTLRSPDATLRESASQLLIGAKPTDSNVLLAVSQTLMFEAAQPSLSTAIQENGASVLKALGPPTDPRVLVKIAHALQSLDDKVRNIASELLISAKPTDPQVIEQIREATHFVAFNPAVRDTVRNNAVRVLDKLGQ